MSSEAESFREVIEKQENLLESIYKEYYGIFDQGDVDISQDKICKFCSNLSSN